MSVPDFVPTPKTPDASDLPASGVKVIDQQVRADGTVRVTFMLPGLREAIVTVPQSSWLALEHLDIGRHLARTLAAVDESLVSSGADGEPEPVEQEYDPTDLAARLPWF